MAFAWVDVAGRFDGARCEARPDGTQALIVVDGDKLGDTANVRSTVLLLRGDTATVVDASRATVPLADAPLPGDELCGAPVFSGTPVPPSP
jgi:hypothetical protein